MAAGLCPQATLEEELEEVLGLEACRCGRELPFGQELGRGLLAAAGIGDQHGPPLTTKASSLSSGGKQCRA